MRIRPKTRVQLYQVSVITIFWVLCGAFLAVYKCVTYDPLSGDYMFIVPQGLTLGAFVLINMIGPFVGGTIGGSILILALNDRLRDKSYGYFLLVTVVFFFLFIFTLNTAVSYFFYHKDVIAAAGDAAFSEFVRLLILDPYAIRNIATWMIIALITLFGLRIYEKYGPGTIISLLKGEYHRPREVERVFMFLDLTDSTAIAERLGHVQFFSLIRDFFRDITDPILNSRGEIYQYVGDEVVVSWAPGKAVADDPHCIACFFRIREAIRQRAHVYREEYGLVPDFKAAVHTGAVVVGETGVIKREITYSGDILNTTARMLDQCKEHGQTLIISRQIIDMVTTESLDHYTLEQLGSMALRGKVQTVELFGVKKRGTIQV